MAKQRKPFVSRKRRKEMDQARARRETFMAQQEEDRKSSDTPVASDNKATISLPFAMTVGEFSQAINLPVTRVITVLVRNGVMAAMNDRVDFDTMSIVADELGFQAVEASTEREITAADTQVSEISEGTEPRAPIVTIMGHVDHGKTSLLDYIRSASVASGEHGGITQHIGAYQAEIPFEGTDRAITFLDTPGHEAFTALRSHGAQVTDIVVLVVAADDGVKPQTIEAINHAKSANVPIIVAINKVDLPDSNIERVKQQVTEHGLIPEEWGGTTIVCGVSAKTGDGVKQLLEYILLTADLKNLKADSKRTAQGVVIESHQEVGLGAVATLLVQTGTLRISDVLVIGGTYGKVRSMVNFKGERITEAGPSTPIRVSGLQTIPSFGESFVSVKNEREAKALTEKMVLPTVRHGIESISQAIAEGRANALTIILKADAQGSLEALKNSIGKISIPGVKTHVIHSGIGDISLNDVQLASTSTAVIFGFHVGVANSVKKAAEQAGVTVSTFTIIYDLLNQIELTLQGRVKVKTIRVERGRLKVKKIFRTSRDTAIVGGEITQGVALKKSFVAVMRDGEQVAEGKVTSLQKGPESVNELEAVQDCGLSLTVNGKVAEGDMLVFSVEEQIVAETEEE